MSAKPKTFLPTSTFVGGGNNKRKDNGGSKEESSANDDRKRLRKSFGGKHKGGWQKHKETVRGYYYELNGNWYVFVCLYKNEVRIHIREYIRIEGNLVPTKVGATLWMDDLEVVKEIGPECYKHWQKSRNEVNGEDIMNHALSDRSDYYLIVGLDQNDELKFCIKICFQSPNGEALTSTNSGATLNLDGWQKFINQLDEIDSSIKEMKKYVVY